MNKRHIIIFVVLSYIALLSGCDKFHYSHSLVKIDSICYTSPQVAIKQLDSMKVFANKLPKADSMYYALLQIKAKDKNYMNITNDSAILTVVSFFKQTEDKNKFAESTYYAGRFFEDKGDAQLALEYYLNARKLFTQSQNFHLLALVNSACGYIFQTQHMPTKACHYFMDAYLCSKKANDTTSMIYNLRDIGCTYRSKAEIKKALIIFKRGYKLARLNSDKVLCRDLLSQIYSVYNEQGQFAETRHHIKSFLDEKERPFQNGSHDIAAEAYYHTGAIDSAKLLYSEISDYGTISGKRRAHLMLANIAEKENNEREALRQIHLYVAYNDSVLTQTNTETVASIEGMYNYNIRIKQISDLKEKKKNYTYIIIGLTFVVFLLVLSILLVYETNRKRRLLYQHKFDTLVLRQKDNEIKKGERHLLINNAQQIISNSNIYKTLEKYIQNEDIDKKIDINWESLTDIINDAYPNFTDRLHELCKMSPKEIHVCLLLKCGFKPAEISKICMTSHQGISSLRTRLYKKAFGKNGNSKQWDDVINDI